MKKFLFLFVIMAFVAVMATGAFAADVAVDCVNPCPDCTPEDTLTVNYRLIGVSCLDVQDEPVYLEADIPCSGVCWGDWVDWTYKVTATGCTNRYILGKVLNEPAEAVFEVDFVNFGNSIQLGASQQTVADGYSNVCDEYTAKVRIGAKAGACNDCDDKTVDLWFKIMDEGCPCPTA